MAEIRVLDLINKLNEIGYDENTKLTFGCVNKDTGGWFDIPFNMLFFGEELTGEPYDNDEINIDLDVDSAKDYLEEKQKDIIDKLRDKIQGVLYHYDD